MIKAGLLSPSCFQLSLASIRCDPELMQPQRLPAQPNTSQHQVEYEWHALGLWRCVRRKPCTSHPGYFCRSIRLHPFQPIQSYVRIAVASFSRTISTNIFPCFLSQARISVMSLATIPLPWMLGSTNKVFREANELIEVEAVMQFMTVRLSAAAS